MNLKQSKFLQKVCVWSSIYISGVPFQTIHSPSDDFPKKEGGVLGNFKKKRLKIS